MGRSCQKSMINLFDGQPWSIPVQPVEDELLSSFLVRVSQAHGQAPTRFCYYHFPSTCIWNRDIDRCASPNLLTQVSTKAGLPLSMVAEMTLSNFCEADLTRLGIYHRVRTRHGLRFCPQCILQYPAYKREWRSAWTAYCSRHRLRLLDACTSCGVVVMPHRSGRNGYCHACGSSLGIQPSSAVAPSESGLLDLQQELLAVDHNPTSSTSEIGAWTSTVREILQRVRKALVAAAQDERAILPECASGSLLHPTPNLCRIDGAMAHLSCARYVLDEWPGSFRRIALAGKLHPDSLGTPGDNWPSQVLTEIARLPPRAVRRPAKPRSSIRNELRQLHRKRTTGWRIRRAKLLIAAAGIRDVN